MKGSILIVGSFVVGCVVGRLGWLPNWWLGGSLSLVVLYALMFQVGIGIGSDSRLKEILRSITPRTILVPCATIVGTIISTFLISFAIVRWSATEVMAVGCGFGYYSLSSILVSSLKEAHIGLQAAAELGTITLIANVFRELMTLLLAPLMVRWFSPLGPICAGGATTIDVTLPVITRFSGRDWLFVSILHGVVVDFSVPFLVPFFCSFN
jgi:uncharacterized membrane protein YbjE (DUF340 family)